MKAAALRALWRLRGRLQGARRICAWCSDFNRSDPKNAGASHGMCPSCADRMASELEAFKQGRSMSSAYHLG